jgi:phosphoenolpyruvate synthase/pyruvate phosphate dikinase
MPSWLGGRIGSWCRVRVFCSRNSLMMTILSGIGASTGTARGNARLIHGPDEFTRFQSGDVLVCRTTDPAWTPLFGMASAVVTETGGMLSHAAIVAREFGIPAVLGVRNALNLLADGGTLAIDGSRGTVTLMDTE